MQKVEQIVCRLTKIIIGSNTGVGNGGWEPFDGCAIADGVGGGDEDLVASIMLGRVAHVKSIKAMDGEGASLCWCFMDDDLGSRDGERRSIKIKIAEEARVGRELRLATGGT